MGAVDTLRGPEEQSGISGRDNRGKQAAPDAPWEENQSFQKIKNFQGRGCAASYLGLRNGTGNDRKGESG